MSSFIPRKQLPEPLRGYASAAILQQVMDRGVAGLQAGTLDKRNGSHLTCLSYDLDEKGWTEVDRAMNEAFGKVAAAISHSRQRLNETDALSIPTTVAIASFQFAPEQRNALGRG